MNIMITGATGLIGQALVDSLINTHTITVVGRDIDKLKQVFKQTCTPLTWSDINRDTIAAMDIVINLAGANVSDKRWNNTFKQTVLNSRVECTHKIASLCATLADESPRLINASAVSIYGMPATHELQEQITFDENSSIAQLPNKNFLTDVAIAWENALQPARNSGVAVTVLRFSAVLAKQGGALAKMLPAFKYGLGAVLGSGQQPYSWVALSDVVSVIQFLIDRPDSTGNFNIVADGILSQHDFAKILAKVLHRPCFMNIPAFVVKTLFGQMADELLLNGTRVKATRLRELGFTFQHNTLADALAHELMS